MHMKGELNAEIGMLWDVQQDTDPKVTGTSYLRPWEEEGGITSPFLTATKDTGDLG